MKFQYTPYMWPLLASSFVTAILCLYAFVQHRHVKCAFSFMLSMAVVTIWSFGNAFEMSGADLSTKLFWANIQYIAYCYSPVALLALCMQFTGYDKWIRSKKFWSLLILPTLIILLVWTDGLHGLMRNNVRMDYSGVFPVIVKSYGPMFYVHAIYSYTLNITAWYMLVRAVFYRKTIYRKQAAALLIGTSMIVIPNLLFILGISPVKRFDITPVFFGPAGILMAWAIFRYKMFELVPFARATVIETMDAGVMVLDLQDRVLDINPAFEKITGLPASAIAAQNIRDVCKNIPELIRACLDRRMTHAEFSIRHEDFEKIYEVLISPLSDSTGVLMGRLAVIHDITEKKQAQKSFLEQQRKLAAVEERERLARNLHDNLGQVLGFINLQAQGIRKELNTTAPEALSDRLDRLVQATQSAHDEIRSYIRSARNMASSNGDLLSALKNDILHFEEQTGILTEFNKGDRFDKVLLESNTQLQILNIVKEAFNNIRKHSRAKHVKISISFDEGLHLSIEDDGIGFTVPKNNGIYEKTFGLNIMRERAKEIGGKLAIDSVPGMGSRIALYVPADAKGGNICEVNACR